MFGLASTSVVQSPLPRVDHSNFFWAELLVNSWVVLALTVSTKDTVVIWECCQSVPIPITITSLLYQVWEKWVALLPPQLIIHSPRVDYSGLVWAEMLVNLWVVLAHTDCIKCAVLVWECRHSVSILHIQSLYKVLARMVGLASASMDHSHSPKNGPLKSRLSWNAVNSWVVLALITHC